MYSTFVLPNWNLLSKMLNGSENNDCYSSECALFEVYSTQTKKAYEKASEEAEAAQVNHDKGDKDQNMTKAKMDKLVTILRTKNSHADDCRTNYVLFLEETNKKQDLHYTSQMPELMTVSVL